MNYLLRQATILSDQIRIELYQILKMAELQEFFDSFTCRVCFEFYSPEQPPFIICNNHHLLCKKCVAIMDEKSRRQFSSSLKCPFCKEHKELTQVSQDRQVLQIKGIVVKIKRQEENQKNQITFIRQNYAILEEEHMHLKEGPCDTHAKKEYQKRLVCYCKNRYFSSPIQQIQVHIESVCELLEKMKRRQQNKMILPSLFFNEQLQPIINAEINKVEQQQSLQEKQKELKIRSLEEILQELISQSFKNAELMNQMIDVYHKKQAYLNDRQKRIEVQLKEKEAQIKLEAQYEFLQYKLDYEQLTKNIKSNMQEARQQLNKRIEEKDIEIRAQKKHYDLMEKKYKRTIDQLNSEFKQLQVSLQLFIKKGPYPANLEDLKDKTASNPENLQRENNYQQKNVFKRRSTAMLPVLMPNHKRLSTPNFIKERANIPHTARNPQRAQITEKVQTQKKIKLEMAQLLFGDNN